MYKNKKILAIIPARGGSKGIKLKNLYKIKGKSLINHVAEVVKKTKKIDYAFVSTDHIQIKKKAIQTKILNVIDRPKNLSGDNISDYKVIKHVINNLKNRIQFDIILMLQPTSILRKPKHIVETIKLLLKKNYDAVWSVNEIDSKYHPYKQLKIKKGKINFFTKKGEKIVARQQLSKTYIRNGAVYAFKKSFFEDNKLIINHNTGFYLIKEPMVSIDTYEDIKFVTKLIK
tara:strand:- start:37648 stop:38337 length:690 start_codon:yes stop_codon:yes gene_type:complete